MNVERDVTDLGLSPELSVEELDALRRRVPAQRAREQDQPSGPPASAARRRQAMADIRRGQGWEPSKAAARLLVRCPRCHAGADGRSWCRPPGRAQGRPGFLHEERQPQPA